MHPGRSGRGSKTAARTQFYTRLISCADAHWGGFSMAGSRSRRDLVGTTKARLIVVLLATRTGAVSTVYVATEWALIVPGDNVSLWVGSQERTWWKDHQVRKLGPVGAVEVWAV